MRNKIFIGVFSALLLFGLVSAPVTRMLVTAGVIEFEDLANYKEPVQVEQGPLYELRQGIENVKAELENIYTNYLPLYNSIINSVANVKDSLNASSNEFLTAWGKQIRDASRPTDTTSDETETGGNTQAPVSTPEDTTLEATAPDITEISDVTPQTTPDISSSVTSVPVVSVTEEVTTTVLPETTPEVTEKAIPGIGVNPDRIVLTDNIESKFLSSGSRWNSYALTFEDENGNKYKMLERAVNLDFSTCKERADAQIADLNRIAAAMPEVNFYVYFGTRLQETDDSEKCFPDVDNMRTVVRYFERELDRSIEVAHFDINSAEEKINTYYLTDHHWNANGMIQAYYEIVDMFKNKYPDFEDAREPIAYYINRDIKFNGIYSRGMNIYDTWDPLDIYEFDLPEHTQVGGRPYSETIEMFKNNQFESGYGLYESMFPYAQSYSYTTNNTGRNLLIIGDSFMMCENEVLASHFDNTYIKHICNMDMFDYENFVKDKNITDVLVLSFDMRLIYNYNDDVRLNRVVTD
jgi:hypothetical protein